MAIVTPGRYSGTNFAAIDGKGRIAVPSQFRNNVPLNADGQRVLWVGFHEKLPCLVGYGQDQYDRLSDEIERDRDTALARNLDFDEDEAFKQRFSYTEAYTLDDSGRRSEEHTSELQSLMRISYAVFCLKKKKKYQQSMN